MNFIWLIHVDSPFFNLRFFQNRIIIVPTIPSYGEDQMILFQINITLQKMLWSRYFFPSFSTGEEAKWALRGSWRSTDLSVSGSVPEHPWTQRAFLFTWLLVAPSPGPMHAVHATGPSPLHLEAACRAFCKLPSRRAGPWGDWKSLSNPCCTGDCAVVCPSCCPENTGKPKTTGGPGLRGCGQHSTGVVRQVEAEEIDSQCFKNST